MSTELDHAPQCARSPINVVAVIIRSRRYELTRCCVCGGQQLTPDKETTT